MFRPLTSQKHGLLAARVACTCVAMGEAWLQHARAIKQILIRYSYDTALCETAEAC